MSAMRKLPDSHGTGRLRLAAYAIAGFAGTSFKHAHLPAILAEGTRDGFFEVHAENLCVPKTSSELMPLWKRLSWRNDRAVLFRSGRPGLAIQVEVAA
jgi:hypothetical protein